MVWNNKYLNNNVKARNNNMNINNSVQKTITMQKQKLVPRQVIAT
jgi:hypothetical protein